MKHTEKCPPLEFDNNQQTIFEQLVDLIYKKYNISGVRPEKKYVYFAYKEGKVKQFTNSFDASNYSNLVERVLINENEILVYNTKIKAAINEIKDCWRVSLFKKAFYVYGIDNELILRSILNIVINSVMFDYSSEINDKELHNKYEENFMSVLTMYFKIKELFNSQS